jgi:hypothetical protein
MSVVACAPPGTDTTRPARGSAIPEVVRLDRECRLESLPPQTRVLLSAGRAATLIRCGFTCALLRLDTGALLEVAPAAELEVLEKGQEPFGGSVATTGGPEIGPPRALGVPQMRQGRAIGTSGRTLRRNASGDPQQPSIGELRCAHCGGPFIPRRPWQRNCSRRCRQAKYAGGLAGRPSNELPRGAVAHEEAVPVGIDHDETEAVRDRAGQDAPCWRWSRSRT